MKNISPKIIITVFLFSCHSNNQPAIAETDSANQNPLNTVSPYRSDIKPDPIAEYSEKVNDNLNDWHFSVKLYETKKTFYYLIRMEYEELKAEDTLKLPNLGLMPKPAIEKGKDKYSCVLGFMDVQNKFNEYKLVHVEKGDIKLTTLKHYYGAVYTK